MIKERIAWLDTVRGLAFISVIYVHISLFCSDIMAVYTDPYFLTVFFFVSGYLCKNENSFTKVLEQRTRTLFVPQLLFGIFTITLQQLYTTQSDVLPLGEYILQLFWHCTERTGGHHGLWFVAALYAFSLVFYWLRRFCKDAQKLFVVCTTLFILNCLYAFYFKGPRLPWYLHEVGFGCFYMSLGVIYKESLESWIDRHSNKLILLIVTAVYVSLIFLYGKSISYSGSPLIIDAFVITLTGIYVCVYWCKYCFYKYSFLNYIGSNSLLYFGFHRKILVVVTMVFAKMYAMSNINHSLVLDEVCHWLDTFIIAGLTMIPTYIVVKYFPWVTGKGYKLWN